jgi:hypothetical protein
VSNQDSTAGKCTIFFFVFWKFKARDVLKYDLNTDFPILMPSPRHAFITARIVIEEAKNNESL